MVDVKIMCRMPLREACHKILKHCAMMGIVSEFLEYDVMNHMHNHPFLSRFEPGDN